ncbi:hypothetical protein GCM10028787_31060 [Brachybacterium horti]
MPGRDCRPSRPLPHLNKDSDMTFLRLSDVTADDHVLVNVEQIVSVRPIRGPRGLQMRALKLAIHLADGRDLECFPVDAEGGFDSTTDDEATALRNFDRAARRASALARADVQALGEVF